MDENQLAQYWAQIPVGKANALDYAALCMMWGVSERRVRRVLHSLSLYDNGDNYILIRSSKNRGFYRTDDAEEIAAYKSEMLRRGRNVFATVKKCNRVLKADTTQYSITNNMLVIRNGCGMLQTDVCKRLAEKGVSLDVGMLSRFENNRAVPLPEVVTALAEVYDCRPSDLIHYEFLEDVG